LKIFSILNETRGWKLKQIIFNKIIEKKTFEDEVKEIMMVKVKFNLG
jgi:hypothetical protein